jgi:hypothetical protein
MDLLMMLAFDQSSAAFRDGVADSSPGKPKTLRHVCYLLNQTLHYLINQVEFGYRVGKVRAFGSLLPLNSPSSV